jgi:UDP-N-acetylglucosamine--N-acetylmuramyl-(pentapeptide) pyrophosphoryl-undecaprenol N-acetylglucosamine transferase
VIGTGGYVSYPVLKAALGLGIPTVIHESNAIPGLATRMLMGRVDLILLGMQNSERAFTRAKRAVYVGVPVDRAFMSTNPELARARLGIGQRKVVLSFGGSLGAEAINRYAMRASAAMEDKGVLWIHASGRRYYDEMRKCCPDRENFRLLPYIEDMPSYLAAADLAICRAGASTLAELQASRTPAILIPSPNVALDHQTKNARLIEQSGDAVVLDERDVDSEEAIELVRTCLQKKSNIVRRHPNAPLPQVLALEKIYELLGKKNI